METQPLPLEKQLELRLIRDSIAVMDMEALRRYAELLAEQMMLREEQYKHLLQHKWGL